MMPKWRLGKKIKAYIFAHYGNKLEVSCSNMIITELRYFKKLLNTNIEHICTTIDIEVTQDNATSLIKFCQQAKPCFYANGTGVGFGSIRHCN